MAASWDGRENNFYMAKAKQLIDIRASKGITVAQSIEHQRNWTEKGWECACARGNYDRTRTDLCFEIVKGGKVQPIDKSISIPKRMAATLAERGIKDPNEGLKEPRFRTIVNIIIGGSRDRMHEIAFGDQKVDLTLGADNSHIKRMPEIEQWAKDMYDFVCGRWGEDNVIGFYVHLDEKNPHIHCTLLPLDENNKFAFKRMFAGQDKYEFRKRTLAIHNDLAEVNKKWGLYRGDSKELTGAKHRTTEEYRLELSQACTSMEEQLESNREVLAQLYADIRMAEKRVKGLNTMIANLEDSKSDLESQIESLQSALNEGRGDSDELQAKIERLKSELASIDNKLADKRSKLNEADRMLAELNAKAEEQKTNSEGLLKQAESAAQDIKQQIRFRLVDALLGQALQDFRNMLPSMSMYERSQCSETMLMDMAERGEQILTCATFLFAGYVDGATKIAESHGGGGGGCSKDWGRDPDEDERAWALRCMQMACRMMKPAIGSSRGVRRR
jgi:chaperonin cofactor prefoldin